MQHSQWKGSTSQKFQIGRRHLEMTNELGPGLKANHYAKNQGLKTFTHHPTAEMQYKPSLGIFPQKYFSNRKEIDLRGKLPLTLPKQLQRVRPELLHINGGQRTFAQHDLRGIRTFSNIPLTKQQYQIQSKLQRKARVLGLQAQRNYIGVTSLGDKAYKYPEYQTDFFKSGGLIPGSTNTYKSSKQQQFTLDEKKLGSVFTKPHWHVKVKLDQAQEDRQVIQNVDDWQKTILPENNPNYNDPQTFFQRYEAQQKAGGKDAKKAPPAKNK